MPLTVSHLVPLAAFAWAWATMVVSITAVLRRVFLGHRFDRLARVAPIPAEPPQRLLLLRPCSGDEPDLEQRLRSKPQLDLPIVIAVADENDGALPAARRAVQALCAASRPARLVIGATAAPNRKVAVLAHAMSKLESLPDIVVCADSNVDLTDFDLGALLAPLRTDQRCGATWAPPTEQPQRRAGNGTARTEGLGARASLAVLGGSLQSFGLLAALDAKGLVGKLFALRRTALDEIGGFSVLSRYLGEDMELARRLRRERWHSRAVPVTAPVRAASNKLGDVIDRQARWMTVIRAQRPHLLLAYPLLFAPVLPIVTVAAASLRWQEPIAAATIAVALAARMLVGLAARHWSGRPVSVLGGFLDMIIGEVVIWAALARTLASRRVRWRGHTLRIGRDGLLRAGG